MPDIHYQHINHILEQFERDLTTPEMPGGHEDKLDVISNKALNDLNNWLSSQIFSPEAIETIAHLLPLIEHGTYANLANEVYKLRNEKDIMKLEAELIKISKKYTSNVKRQTKKEIEPLQPKIIISETFV